MTPAEGISRQLDDYRTEFERGDYQAFFKALLLCCWSSVPLPEWVYTLVIQQAEDAFNKHSTGPGRTGNWRSKLSRLQIDRQRAYNVEMHLRCRRRVGRHYVSWVAALDGYGTPSERHPGENIVTLADIIEAVAVRSQDTAWRGTAGEVLASYRAVVKSRGRRKRQLGVAK